MAGSKKNQKDQVQSDDFQVEGRLAKITRLGEKEIVEIDGRVIGYYETDGGYLLKTDVYQRPAKTLREAVERYLKREVSK